MSYYALARRRLLSSKLICRQYLLTTPPPPSPLIPQYSAYSTSHAPTTSAAPSALTTPYHASPSTSAYTPSPSAPYSTSTPAPSKPNSRWLSDTKARLGKCINFGLSGAHIPQASRISHTLAYEWRGLVAGAEGFLVSDGLPGTAAKKKYGTSPALAENVLWGEQDTMGHVNNVMYVRYAESSRIHYFRRLGQVVGRERRGVWGELRGNMGVGLILKAISVEFLFPLKFPDRLTLCHRLEGLEGGGLGFRCAVLSHGEQRVAAKVREEVLTYDYRVGKRVELEPWVREVFEGAQREEREASEYWIKRREEVEGWVRDLERETVLSGKEEDMGGQI